MLRLVDYVLIGGTILLLGGSVVSLVAVCVIRVYLGIRYGIVEHDRWVTYARDEAPHAFNVARFWLYRLAIIAFALLFAYIAFAGFIFMCFMGP
jgi:hypothetical protein